MGILQDWYLWGLILCLNLPSNFSMFSIMKSIHIQQFKTGKNQGVTIFTYHRHWLPWQPFFLKLKSFVWSSYYLQNVYTKLSKMGSKVTYLSLFWPNSRNMRKTGESHLKDHSHRRWLWKGHRFLISNFIYILISLKLPHNIMKNSRMYAHILKLWNMT